MASPRALQVQLRLSRASGSDRLKRRRDPLDGESDSNESGGHHTDRETDRSTHKKPMYYAARQREEIESLQQQVREMQARVEELEEAARRAEDASIGSAESRNRSLDELRRSQLLTLGNGRAMLNQFWRELFDGPLSVPIHLGRDMADRRATLMAVRRKKLDTAYRFLESELQGVDGRTPFKDHQQWTSARGDVCFLRSDVTIFEEATSVKQVFDALLFYMTNMEISISEELGNLTLREDYDCIDTRISNHRIIATNPSGLIMEMNTAMFAEYYASFPELGDEPFALLTNDSVDQDDLYPYCPEERVRKIVRFATSVRSFRRPSRSNPEEEELVVALRRCAYLAIEKPTYEVSPTALQEVIDAVPVWGDVMLKTIQDKLKLQNGDIV